MKKIIILIGPICAGKGQVAQILSQSYGYTKLRFSQILEEEMARRNIEISRENYQKLGNELRHEFGSQALAIKIVEKINNQNIQKAVIDGARNPLEITYIRNHIPDASICAVVIDAPQQLRFERLLQRKREGDPQSFEVFKQRDDKELYGDGTPHSQRIMDCMQMSDDVIDNDASYDQLVDKLNTLLQTHDLR